MDSLAPAFVPAPAPSLLAAPSVPFPPDGQAVAVVDKPLGLTSQRVVGQLRRLLGVRKVGHAGTLDPAASGVLIVGVGRATRLLTYFVGADKTYRATVAFGASTTTEDAQGDVTDAAGADPALVARRLPAALQRFRGDIMQRPSAVSALKVDGERAYRRVRRGEAVRLPARAVTIHALTLLGGPRPAQLGETQLAAVDLEVRCSSGTYVRALARDLGRALGCGAHLAALRRTQAGPFTLADAHAMGEFAAGLGQAPADSPLLLGAGAAAARVFPALRVSDREAAALACGKTLPLPPTAPAAPDPPAPARPNHCVLDRRGRLVALVRAVDATIRPLAVFVTQ